ncbi:hypothetical protein AIOL_004674 [Candidatus Rhodobacter oscarellae]|uniref:Major facilitator superfamily (MFS) profile domain-containing protein n=1 Tax=Candidatus Rhodobacter oscarellae TaxID=1675527 RepID=A0A0J9EA85_9RHOB|nr:MFS transporter [Candidatus Rhodobacter lobularis]KMW59692.1 hypothetical protein AIOL_004674 [Candidatus Rhodobacter lobularis]
MDDIEKGKTLAPWKDLLVRQHAASLLIVCTAVVLHAADGLLVATMLPVIVADIGGTNLISWVVMLYEVGSITVGAASGFILVRMGLRVPMAQSAFCFSAGCVASALASSMPIMLWGRVLQGFGGGGLMAMSFVAVTLLFERRLRARAMALVSTMWAGSAFLGPLMGGLFVELASWRAAFWTFACFAMLLGLFIFWAAPIRSKPETAKQGLPVVRLAVLIAGILAIAFAGEEIHLWRTLPLIGTGLGLLGIFFWQDAQHSNTRLLPAFDPRLRDRPSAMILLAASFAAATIAIGAFAPFFLVNLHGFTPLQAGYLIAIEAVAWAGTAALVSGRPETSDARMIKIGLVTVAIGVLGLSVSMANGPIALIGFAALLQGAGFGMAWTLIPRFATQELSVNESAVVVGALPTVQRIGYAIGAALIGVVANAAGIESADTNFAATAIFTAGIPMALIGLFALRRFCASDS